MTEVRLFSATDFLYNFVIFVIIIFFFFLAFHLHHWYQEGPVSLGMVYSSKNLEIFQSTVISELKSRSELWRKMELCFKLLTKTRFVVCWFIENCPRKILLYVSIMSLKERSFCYWRGDFSGWQLADTVIWIKFMNGSWFHLNKIQLKICWLF